MRTDSVAVGANHLAFLDFRLHLLDGASAHLAHVLYLQRGVQVVKIHYVVGITNTTVEARNVLCCAHVLGVLLL